jgi:uncharacterized protein
MATVLITGGTGMIGTALTEKLISKGYDVIILTRKKKNSNGNISYAEWNIEKGVIEKQAIEKADYIVHLAGANVGEKRWSKKRKQEIVDSRVKSSQLLVKYLESTPNKVKAVVSASGIGWYKEDPQIPNPKPFVETDPPDDSFLGNTGKLWEESIKPVKDLGKRLVYLRTGIVLSNEGGAFPEFKKPFLFRTATILGNGKQVVSWIHIDDLVNLYIYAIENENLSGIYNAVAPETVSNKKLMNTIGDSLNKKYISVPVPEFALKIVLGELSIEVLKSATVSSAKIEGDGFEFKYRNVEDAINDLIHANK